MLSYRTTKSKDPFHRRRRRRLRTYGERKRVKWEKTAEERAESFFKGQKWALLTHSIRTSSKLSKALRKKRESKVAFCGLLCQPAQRTRRRQGRGNPSFSAACCCFWRGGELRQTRWFGVRGGGGGGVRDRGRERERKEKREEKDLKGEGTVL